MTTLGEAFIEVHADTRPFARELGPKLKRIIDDIEPEVKGEAVKLGSGISKGVADGVDKDSDRIKKSFRRVGDTFDKQGRSWLDKLRAPFERMSKGNFIVTRIFGQMVVASGKATVAISRFAGTAIKTVGALTAFGAALGDVAVQSFKVALGLGGNFSKAMSNAFLTAQEAVSAMLSLGSALLSMLPTIIATGGAVLLLVAAIAALAAILIVALAPFATLVGFLVAVPALVGVLLSVIGPLIVAFHGLSDAMGLVFEKDPKKLADGLKKLSPTLAGIVTALRPLVPMFNKFRDSVQAAFLGPILTQLAPVLRQILPVLSVGFTAVAQALGNIVLSIMRLISSRAALDGIAFIMGSVAQFLDTNAGTITALIEAFGKAAVAMLPTVLELLTKFSGFLTEFAAWIEGAITDGRFQRWLDTAIASAQSIWNLIKALIGLLREMFAATDEGGRQFLDKVTQAVNKFTAWLKSPQGQQALANAVALAIKFAEFLALALDNVTKILTVFNKVADVIRWIKNNPITAPVLGIFGGGVPGFSGGGVVPHDEMAMVHKGEPILDPANSVSRNRSILQDAGMLDVLSGTTIVNVYLGTEKLDARIERKVARNNQMNAMALASGPRGA